MFNEIEQSTIITAVLKIRNENIKENLEMFFIAAYLSRALIMF